MKKGWIIGIGIVVALIVGLIVKAKQWFKELKYGIAPGFQLLQVGVREVRVLVPVYIYNPTPFNAIISDMNLRIYFDEYYISTVQVKGNYALRPKEYSTYPLEFKVSTGQVLKYLAERGEVINDPKWTKKVRVSVDGTVTADIGIIKLYNQRVQFNDSLKSYVG